MTPPMARLSSPLAAAGRLVYGWITIVTGELAISFSGATATRVPPIGGMNRLVSGIWDIRASGAPTIIPAQSRPTGVTGVMAGTRFPVRQLRRPYDNHWPTRKHSEMNAQLIVPAPRPSVAGRSMTLVANVQPAFPDPHPLQLNTQHPSAGRNRMAHSSAFKVRMMRKPIAIAASKACRRSPTPRQYLIQHLLRDRRRQCPPAVVVVSAVAVIEVAVAGVNFLFL